MVGFAVRLNQPEIDEWPLLQRCSGTEKSRLFTLDKHDFDKKIAAFPGAIGLPFVGQNG